MAKVIKYKGVKYVRLDAFEGDTSSALAHANKLLGAIEKFKQSSREGGKFFYEASHHSVKAREIEALYREAINTLDSLGINLISFEMSLGKR